MINFNGSLIDNPPITAKNRGLNYGDALFETIRVINNSIMFWEAHYFRLMSSMRMLRMEIPMSFSPEKLENQIKDTIKANDLTEKPVKVKLLVARKDGGLYLPKSREVDVVITVEAIENSFFVNNKDHYVVDLFKDHFILAGMLSTLKTTNKITQVLASIFAEENSFDNCILLNEKKSVVEFTNGNLFLVKGKKIKTPPLSDGCLKGIIRGELIKMLKKLDDYTLEETSISPFELQKADELFLTNSIIGIKSVHQYRKKTYNTKLANQLIGKLNAQARLVE
ncbi:aminotransferase class IV [Psychroflexus sp. ALD_RP9]|uniref:aminotransferase class IV n=1 Tax=Psychroflexus sp. ALD_RP9 TaxID=2777186 RepID=UPI001A8CC9FA|nr:aminotransferase class IV [Psychroflexus sp. ALD_RP9]QSS97326.1 aminotransferase class IV [Psychroflexus sp. ALD_RP9]